MGFSKYKKIINTVYQLVTIKSLFLILYRTTVFKNYIRWFFRYLENFVFYWYL